MCCREVLGKSIFGKCMWEVLGQSVVGNCVWGSVVKVF